MLTKNNNVSFQIRKQLRAVNVQLSEQLDEQKRDNSQLQKELKKTQIENSWLNAENVEL